MKNRKISLNKMKIFISLLLLIASVFSYYILYNNEQMRYSGSVQQIEDNMPYSHNIMIPGKIDNENRADIYNKIVDNLEKYNASIYYDRVSKDGNVRIKYIYDKEMKYISQLNIKSGDVLNSQNMNSNKFISTRKTKDENQIGVISNFNKNGERDVKTLKSMLDDGFNFSGSCYVAFNDEVDIQSFINDLESSLNIQGIIILEKQNININSTSENNYKWIIIIIYFIVVLLILYDLLNSYKKIAVKKLM